MISDPIQTEGGRFVVQMGVVAAAVAAAVWGVVKWLAKSWFQKLEGEVSEHGVKIEDLKNRVTTLEVREESRDRTLDKIDRKLDRVHERLDTFAEKLAVLGNVSKRD